MIAYVTFYYISDIVLLLLALFFCRSNYVKSQAVFSRYNVVFLSLLLIMVFLMRLPSLYYNEELNGDESQIITSAITLAHDPVYGRRVDGTTLGPINSYSLFLPYFFGRPFDYTSARYTGLFYICASILLFYFSLLQISSVWTARICSLLIAVFFSWATDRDFIHYSSELPSLLIITLCFLLSIHAFSAQVIRPGYLLILGIVAGITPYSKLQPLPIVGMMLLLVCIYLFSRYKGQAWRYVIATGFGFFLPSLAIFGLASYFGVLAYFIDYYFIGNLATYSQIYADVPLVHQSFLVKLIHFPSFLKQYSDILVLIIFPCILCIGLAVIRLGSSAVIGRLFLEKRWTILLIIAVTISTLWAVITPGTEFGHHLLLLVFPLGWLMAICLYWASRSQSTNYDFLTKITAGLIVLNLVITDNVLHAFGYRLLKKNAEATDSSVALSSKQHWLHNINPTLFSFPYKTRLIKSPVSALIARYNKSKDKLAVWGWNCSYYVETDSPQGVSEAHAQRSIVPNKMQGMYLNRYANELLRNKPGIFVDAVGKYSGTLNQEDERHEHYPVIAAIVRDRYRLVGVVEDVRIYVLKEKKTS